MIVVDAQLPPALTVWFRERGLEAEHVGPLMGDAAASDERIWAHARQPGWMILSKDQDFVDRGILYGPPPIVIQVNLGNCWPARGNQSCGDGGERPVRGCDRSCVCITSRLR